MTLENCPKFPMPTMNGLNVGEPIGVVQAAPSVSCVPETPPPATPLPKPTPANLTMDTPPSPTKTRRARIIQPPAKLNRPPFDPRLAGPFPQTLFMGCSVVDFNVNLGWGSNDGSTLTVTLVRDTMPTFAVSAGSIADKSARYAGMDHGVLKAAAESVREVPNHYYNSMKPPKALIESLQNALASLPANYTEEQYQRVLDAHIWNPPEPFKDVNGNPIVPGKLYYEYNTSTKTYEQKYWLGPDPGFIGDKDGNAFTYQGSKGWSVGIIGAPVRFVMDEFVFCGVVTDWRKNISSGGIQYTVTIQTPVHLVRNAKLILGHYAGSVFTKNTALPVITPPPRAEYDTTIPLTPWESLYQASYPSAFVAFNRVYKSYISGPVNITDSFVGNQAAYNKFVDQSWKGDIKNDGNLPNVINVYGFLESLGPGFFGGARFNELGIKYNTIIGALSAMLSTPSPSPFNPFGGLVGMSAEPPFKNPQNADNNWIEVFHLGDRPQVQDSLSVPDAQTALGNIGGSVNPAAQNASASYSNTTYGGPKTIWDFGFIPPVLSTTSNTYKQLYYLDLTELPVMPDLLRYDCISQKTVSIGDFIDEVCEKGGSEYFWEMLNLNNGFGAANYNILKLRTVSRKSQPPDNVIEEYLRAYIGAQTQIDYGKEFNADAKTRVMYIGGKQKRLFQAKNFRLGKSQSVHIYSPITKRFVVLDTKERNKVRMPNAASVRHPLTLLRGAENTNLNEIATTFFANDENWRSTQYDGGGGERFQTEANDENPAVQRAEPNNAGKGPARKRASKTTVTESPIVWQGNYLPSTTLPLNRYKDIVSYKIRSQQSRENSGNKKTFQQVLQQGVDIVYQGLLGAAFTGLQLATNVVGRWLKMRTTNTPWKSPATPPAFTNVYGEDETTNIGVKSKKSKTNIETKITTINRFFPLMHDVICPYFGSYRVLPIDGLANFYNNADYIKTPRPVWYDMWTNQIVVVFNVADLPRTRMILTGTYANGTSFIVTESELRAALANEDAWINYLSAKLFKPDIVHMIKKALCPLSTTIPIPPVDPPTQRGTSEGLADRRNDPAAAGQAAEIATDGGAGSSVPASNAFGFDVDNLDECDFCKIFMALFKMPKLNLMNGSVLHATPPINLKAGLASAIYDDLIILHSFFQNVARKFYGREFMVKLPMVRTYIDRTTYIIDEGFSSGSDYLGAMRIMEGDGKIYSNYKISTQGAWEEAGNSIDDQMVIGGWYSNIFTNDNGLIGPILGFWSSMGFDYESYFICKLLKDQKDKLDPEKTRGSLFKLGDIVQPKRVCLDNTAGTAGTVTDNSSTTPVTDPRTKPLQRGTEDHQGV